MTAGTVARLWGLVAAVVVAAGSNIGAAAVFPGVGATPTTGARPGLYMVLRGVNDAPLAQSRIDDIRASEQITRRFYAANSGGKFDLRYADIVDVPLTLNADRTRPDDWWGLAESYVRSHKGIEPENYYSNVFDVSGTARDPGQGWSGVAIIPSNNYATQENVRTSWGQIVIDHEMGHRVGAPHSGAWRILDDDNHTPYVWDRNAKQYVLYNPARHRSQAAPYGVHRDEYGNPFDVMGNISHGHFNVRTKRDEFHWLSTAQVPNLSTLGAGTYRIYAHDELSAVQDSRSGAWGVEETYDADALYGLTYTRPAERFSTSAGRFENYTQTITIEYRRSRDGVQFYLGDNILDLDIGGGSDRNNLERELEIGLSIEEIDFAMSTYQSSGDGDDFLSHNPPPPRDPWEIASRWFKFDVLRMGQDDVGSYIDLGVELIRSFAEGDFNDDGLWNMADVDVFRQNWLTSTSGLTYRGKHERADLNFSGRVDLDDWSLVRTTFAQHGLMLPANFVIPEPAAGVLALAAIVGLRGARGRSRHRSAAARRAVVNGQQPLAD